MRHVLIKYVPKSTPPFSGLLRGVRGFETDVSGLPIGPIFKGQDFHVLLDILTLKLT
jgi:hypothetical protein